MADRFWGSLLCWICFLLAAARANVQSKVRCSEETMEVDIVRSSPQARIYLQQLKDFPDETCKPRLSNGVATFRLSLLDQDMLRCGITRVVNKRTGQKVYYHRIIVEEPANSSKHTFTVKCVITEVVVQPPEISMTANHTTVRRSVLPAGFQESEDYDLGEPILRYAPSPTLNVGVRQGGVLVTNELNVSPGTPLQMEIYLDNSSAPIYGLLMTYMQVTDTKSQEETIIFNGCSVDPYLFENFNTVDGDFLVAKFRAFKFPESTFVQFHGTVNVCLDKCQGVECSNGQIGFGRRRRRAIQMGSDKNKIFEVTLSTTIKVDVAKNGMIGEVLSEFIRKGKNKRVTAEEINDMPSATTLRTEEKPTIEEEKAMIGKETQEKFKYNFTAEEISGCARSGATTSLLISFVLFCLCKVL